MSDLQARIRQTIDAFVRDLDAVVRQAALESVHAAFADGARGGAGRGASAALGVGMERRPGAKRTPEELEQAKARLLAHVAANPGHRIEEIATSLGVATRDLALPAKHLIAAKKLKTRGHKRATKYFPR